MPDKFHKITKSELLPSSLKLIILTSIGTMGCQLAVYRGRDVINRSQTRNLCYPIGSFIPAQAKINLASFVYFETSYSLINIHLKSDSLNPGNH